jgi:tRNA pseudouridine55 synthase
MNGVLVVDKPAGPTSHDVVARVRRALGTSRIGHTGTLDPSATGVLPLVIGRATRLAQFLTADDKEYEAGVRLGRATRTYDADDRFPSDSGEFAAPVPPPVLPPEGVDAARIEALLASFTGAYLQTPPPFSAKKISGIPAYKLARRDQPVAIQPVPVEVRELTLESYTDGLARIRVVCSAGFYVRTLAHELGERLGCGAHLETLRRTRAGVFGLDRAVALTLVEQSGPAAATHIIPMGSLLPCLPPVVVNERGARRAAHGNALTPADFTSPPAPAPGGRMRILDEDGRLLGIAEPTDAGLLHPVVVLV